MFNKYEHEKPFKNFGGLFQVFVAGLILLVCLVGYSVVDNSREPVKDKRQQIVTIKNNGQEIVYYIDNDKVKLGYEDKE